MQTRDRDYLFIYYGERGYNNLSGVQIYNFKFEYTDVKIVRKYDANGCDKFFRNLIYSRICAKHN